MATIDCALLEKNYASNQFTNKNVDQAEELDGVRLTFNAFPTTVDLARSAQCPLACIYKPLLSRQDIALVEYEPVVCPSAQCKGLLNPFCAIEPQVGTWRCAMCDTISALPPGYMHLTQDNLPTECRPQNATMEYILHSRAQRAQASQTMEDSSPLLFLFVVDTSLEEDELAALKDSLLVSLSLLPPNARVGLITYNKHVYVHRMSPTMDCSRMLALKGDKDYLPNDIHQKLGFGSLRSDPSNTANSATAPQHQTSFPMGYGAAAQTLRTSQDYFLPLEQVEFEFNEKLEQILGSSFPTKAEARSERAGGTALNVAISLIEAVASHSQTAVQLLFFAGGPCTFGPRAGGGGGVMVGLKLREPLRSHSDIDAETNAARYFDQASKLYKMLAERAVKVGICINIFAASYDQTGYAEMQSLTDDTGGVVVLTDSFTTTIFKQSFIRTFSTDQNGDLEFGADAVLGVKTSGALKLCGYLGQGASLERKSKDVVSPQDYTDQFKLGVPTQSCGWKLCGIRANTTCAIFFTPSTATVAGPSANQAVIQFTTHYTHSSGDVRLRVTTISRPRVPSVADLVPYIDQETMAVILARVAVYKSLHGTHYSDLIQWIDNILIKVCKTYGQYVLNDSSSFRLPPQLTYFPQFLYHLRRSPFLQVFNASPDETAYYQHNLMIQDVNNSSIMIQPTLTGYDLDEEPQPVLLDAMSIKPERILLLDTFFQIVIFHGATVAAWRKAGYAEDPQYENLSRLLEQPRKDAADLLIDRFPLPRFVDTEARGSQARFLMARLNPSKGGIGPDQALVLTDDVSLQDFMGVLMNIAVESGKK